MNKTRFWRIARIAVITLIGIALLFFAWGMYKTFFMKGIISNDVEDYISGRYLSFPGGDMIGDCIPTYEKLGDYDSISFYYADWRRKTNFFHKYYISFGLDVRYTDEEYPEKKKQAGATEDFFGAVGGYKLIDKGSLDHVTFYVGYRDKVNTIRYVAVCGEDINADTDALGLIIWNDPTPVPSQ